MKLLVFLSALLFVTPACCQLWNITEEFIGEAEAVGVHVLENDNIAVIVNTDEGAFAIKYTEEGAEVKRKFILEGEVFLSEIINGQIHIGGQMLDFFDDHSFHYILNSEFDIVDSSTYDGGFVSAVKIIDGETYLGGRSGSDAVFRKIGPNGYEQTYELIRHSFVIDFIDKGSEIVLVCYASVTGAGFHGIVNLGISKLNGQVNWRKDYDLGAYTTWRNRTDNRFAPHGFVYDEGSDVFLVDIQTYYNKEIYTFDLLGELLYSYPISDSDGFDSHFMVQVENNELILGGFYGDRDSSFACLEKRNLDGRLIWHKKLDKGVFLDAAQSGDFIYTVGMSENYQSNLIEDYNPLIQKIGINGEVFNSRLQLNCHIDLSGDCVKDATFLNEILISITINNQKWFPDENCIIDVDLPAGDYSIEYNVPSVFEKCQNNPNSISIGENEELVRDIVFGKKLCQDLQQGLFVSELIRCEHSSLIAELKNVGTSAINDVNVKIFIDDNLTMLSADYNYQVMDDALVFNIDEIGEGENIQINVDFRVPCHLDLYSTSCIEMEVSPKVSCDEELNNWNNSLINIEAICDNGEAVFHLVNEGNNFGFPTQYSVYSNAFKVEEDQILVSNNQPEELRYVPNGQTISIIAKQAEGYPGTKLISASLESCGSQNNGNYSKGYKQMYLQNQQIEGKSIQCRKINDYYRGDQLYPINRAWGRYRMTNKDFTAGPEFNIQYEFDEDENIQNFSIDVIVSEGFKPSSFNPFVCSHKISIEQKNDYLISVVVEEVNELLGSEFNLRFGLDFEDEIKNEQFLSVESVGIKNQREIIRMPIVYYNYFEDFNSEGIAPYVDEDEAFLFGKPDLAFHTDVLDVGSRLLHWSSQYEYGESTSFLISSMDDKNILLKQTEIPMDSIGFVNKLLKIDDEEYWSIGSMRDPSQEPYVNYSYLIINSFDNNSNKNWTKKWKVDQTLINGGELMDGIVVNHNNIILAGSSQTDEGLRNYLVSVNGQGEIIWDKNYYYDNNRSNRFIKIFEISGDRFVVGFEDRFLIFDYNGNMLSNKLLPEFPEPTTRYVRDFHIDDDVIYVALNYRSSEDNQFSEFGVATYDLNCNLNSNHQLEFDQYLFYGLEEIIAFNNEIYLSAYIYQDTTTQFTNLAIFKLDDDYEVEWLKEKDFNTREYTDGFRILADGRIVAGLQTQATSNFSQLMSGYFITDPTGQIPTSVNIVEVLPEIKVFPNPAMSNFEIEGIEIDKIQVFDSAGRQIACPKVSNQRYDCSSFETGIHFINIIDEDGKRNVVKFVKVTD